MVPASYRFSRTLTVQSKGGHRMRRMAILLGRPFEKSIKESTENYSQSEKDRLPIESENVLQNNNQLSSIGKVVHQHQMPCAMICFTIIAKILSACSHSDTMDDTHPLLSCFKFLHEFPQKVSIFRSYFCVLVECLNKIFIKHPRPSVKTSVTLNEFTPSFKNLEYIRSFIIIKTKWRKMTMILTYWPLHDSSTLRFPGKSDKNFIFSPFSRFRLANFYRPMFFGIKTAHLELSDHKAELVPRFLGSAHCDKNVIVPLLKEIVRVSSSIEPTVLGSGGDRKRKQSRKQSSQKNSGTRSISYSGIGMTSSFSGLTGSVGSGSGGGSGEGDGQRDDRKPPRPGMGRKRFQRKKAKDSKNKQVTVPTAVARVTKPGIKARRKSMYRRFLTKNGLQAVALYEARQCTRTGSSLLRVVTRSSSGKADSQDRVKEANLPSAMMAEHKKDKGELVSSMLPPPPPPPASGVDSVRDRPGPLSYAEVVKKGRPASAMLKGAKSAVKLPNSDTQPVISKGQQSLTVTGPPDSPQNGQREVSPSEQCNDSNPYRASGVDPEPADSLVVIPLPRPLTAARDSVALVPPFEVPNPEGVCPLSFTKVITRQRSYTGVQQEDEPFDNSEPEATPQMDPQAGATVQIVEPMQASELSDSRRTTLVVGGWEMRAVSSTPPIEESLSPNSCPSSEAQLVCSSGLSSLPNMGNGCCLVAVCVESCGFRYLSTQTDGYGDHSGLLENTEYACPSPATHPRDQLHEHAC